MCLCVCADERDCVCEGEGEEGGRKGGGEEGGRVREKEVVGVGMDHNGACHPHVLVGVSGQSQGHDVQGTMHKAQGQGMVMGIEMRMGMGMGMGMGMEAGWESWEDGWERWCGWQKC